ncbi:MAG: class I SAM-dependent methyltransferase [Acidobacteria bacterium]|nr:class I SAM-dependent methyltransferase [Acidobacteriota bacterium]
MDRLLEATQEAERRHFWFRGFRRFLRPFLDGGVAGVARPRILDCGCGTGGNFRLLDAYGRTFGCELTRTGIEFARLHHHRLTRASVTHLPFPDCRFDLVTSFDVLYCLEDADEIAAAREMWRVLKPGGAAVINVAAMRILTGNHSVLSEEVRRYSKQSLRRLLVDTGFTVVRMTHTYATLFPVMLLVRTGQRLAGLAAEEHASREITVPPSPVNEILSGVLTLESIALRFVDMPVGSSILCLARKPTR